MKSDPQTQIWRICLASIAISNVLAFTYTLLTPCKNEGTRLQRMLCIPYVFQTTWRSIFISEYVNRHTITNSRFNSPMLARLLAAVGEFCFGIQLTLTLKKEWKEEMLHFVPCFIVLFDFIGQCCATLGTTLQHNGLFFLEGIMWTMIFAICSFSALINVFSSTMWFVVFASSTLGLVYMIVGYCPMCFEAWRKQRKIAITWKSIKAGFYEALNSTNKTLDWGVWKHECVWQTLYFSFGTWCSIGFTL